MDISVNYENTTKCGEKVKELANEYNRELNKINVLIASLANNWEGTDAEKYLGLIKSDYIPKLKELSKVIEEYGVYLKNVSTSYNMLDTAFASKKIEV